MTELSQLRQDIILSAKFWTKPGGYKVTPEELIHIFTEAGCEQVPTLDEANRAIKAGGNGVRVAGQVKHWCGIFGTYILQSVGVDVAWSLVKGKPVGTELVFCSGAKDILPGDMGLIKAGNHHFIITDVDHENGIVRSVDGNTYGQKIRQMERPLSALYGYYRVQE